MPAKTTRIGQSNARPVLTAAQKRAASDSARADKARKAAAAEAARLAALDPNDEHGETEDAAEVDAALAQAAAEDAERAAQIEQDRLDDDFFDTIGEAGHAADVPKTSTLAASRAAATAAATAGTLPPRSPAVEEAKRQATSAAAFEWRRGDSGAPGGGKLDPNEILVMFLIDQCSPEHTAPNQGKPFINENGRVFLHTEWFMAWVLEEYGLTPPKSAVSKLFRDHGLAPRAFPFPGESYSRGLYQGDAPAGTEGVERRGKAPRAENGTVAAPPSKQMEDLGEALCKDVDDAIAAWKELAGGADDPEPHALGKDELAWLAGRVARHIRTLKS